MKKSFLALASFAAIAVGCQVEKMTDELPLVDETVVYEAVTEAYAPATKTAMDGLDVVWSAGDNIAVYQTMSPAKFVVTSESAGNTAAKFTLVTAAEEGYEAIDANVAVYPYSSEVFVIPEMDLDENFDMVPTGLYKLQGYEIPSTQTYAPNSFGNGAFPMVALNEDVEDRTFEFKNILGAVKLQLTGTKTVKSIRFAGNSGEYLAGMPQQIVFGADETPEIVWNSYEPGESAVTLDCGEGVQLDPNTDTDFVLAVAPTVFEEGFTITIFTTDGGTYQIKTAKEQNVERSKVLAMLPKNLDENSIGVSLRATSGFSDVSLEVNIEREDVSGFYGIFVPVEKWPEIKMYLDYGYFTFDNILQGIMGNEVPARFYGKTFTGNLSEFGLSDQYISYGESNMIMPNTSYYAIIVPGNELPVVGGGDEDDLGGLAPLDLDEEGGESSNGTYTLDDAIFYEVTTIGFVTGGDIAEPECVVVDDYLTAIATITPSQNVVYAMFEVFHEGDVLPTEDNYIEMITNDASYSVEDGYFEVEVGNDTKIHSGSKHTVAVLLADANGKTSFYTFEVNLKALPIDNTLAVEFAEVGYEGADTEDNLDDDYIYVEFTYPSDAAEIYYLHTPANPVPAIYGEDYVLYTKENALANVVKGTSDYTCISIGEDTEDTISLELTPKGPKSNQHDEFVVVIVLSKEGKVSPYCITEAIPVPQRDND